MVKGVVWSVFISNLFLCQFREVDSGFRRKKSQATSSLYSETARFGCVEASALCRPAYKASVVHSGRDER